MELYNFKKSYEKDWLDFSSQFEWEYADEDDYLGTIKTWCLELSEQLKKLYEAAPGYGTQMDIYFHWCWLKEILGKNPKHPIGQKVLTWFCQQLYNMICCDDAEVQESIWYAIGVNYFECGTSGYWLFLPLYRQLPEKELERLILHSCSIDWGAKKEAYHEVAKNKKHHRFLAEALYDSTNAYCYGAIKASEGLAVLEKLNIDAALQQKVYQKLTEPIEIVVEEVIPVTPRKKQKTKCFISISGVGVYTFPTWVPFAALWVEDICIGTLENCDISHSWSYAAKEYNFEAPQSGGRILSFDTILPQNLKGKKGFLRPL